MKSKINAGTKVWWDGRDGQFKPAWGTVLRIEGDMACIVFSGWEFGQWRFLSELHTKRK